MSDQLSLLIDQLIAADEWPAPDLLQAILDHGDAAIAPLRDIAHAAEDTWPTIFAARLLASLNAQSAAPDLVNLYRVLDGDILDILLGPVALLGEAVIDPALAVVRETALRWYPRAMAANVARDAAGSDPLLCQRVATALRDLLARSLAQVAAGLELNDDDAMLVSSFVSDLAHLADPAARPIIEAAFDAELVDEFMIRREDVGSMYRQPNRWRHPNEAATWLTRYRETYRSHLADVKRGEREARQPQPQAVTPSKSAPKPGRNDPCWCGSGKKYKHCHLGQDRQ